MKELLSDFRTALAASLALAVVCCGLYPLAVFGIGRLAFRDRADGSLIRDERGEVRGSEFIGQAFEGDRYFHSRPSAAGGGYDAAASGGSNLGPTSKALRDEIARRVGAFRAGNGSGGGAPVPADAVTASGSGLDPHISPESAWRQAARVAAARGLSVDAVKAAIRESTEPPQLGFLGEWRVHVLRLNRALDRAMQARNKP